MTEVKREDLREGDLVDLMLRGLRFSHFEVGNRPNFVTVEGSVWPLAKEWLTDATITRRDPPIEVGDVVNVRDRPFLPFAVIATHDNSAWVECEDEGLSFLAVLSDLTLISKGPKA